MICKNGAKYIAPGVVVFFVCVCLLYSSNARGSEVAATPKMPAHWKVTSDALLPSEQVKAMSSKLDVNFSSVRNTVYDVNGKRVQLNVIITPDPANAEKLMAKLRSMKSEEALLRKELTVYEFVGPNEVLSVIAEGRKHLASM